VRQIRLHDTRRGEVVDFEPRDPGRASIYACGPTVYSRIHIGNARPFVVYSLLKRFLEAEGLETTLVMNITDVNDKIYDAAREADPPLASDELARQMAAAYIADTDALGLGRPDHEPLAGETIDGIVGLIGELIGNGSAYAVDGDVYFSVRSDPAYGGLSHRSVDAMDQGEGVEGADRKRDPLDFALWKARKEGEDTSWDAPWGRGRPGWHIECSAMAEGLLGVDFDIHGGGNDLVFPHHENEAAQTRMARGSELARIWMHNGMLQLGGEKMAKSTGNIESLAEVLDRWGREAVILFFVSGHYRQPLLFGDTELEAARTSARRIREQAARTVPGPSPGELASHREAFFDALADDFNTPRALAELHAWLKGASGTEAPGDDDLRAMLTCLGLESLMEAAEGEQAGEAELGLMEEREAARAEGNFERADAIRDELAALGWEVRDGADGPELVRR